MSDELTNIWGLGLAVIGSVSFDSAAYVARYIMKKRTGPLAAAHYERVVPDTGEIISLLPEFTVMSRRPGIGQVWYDRFGEQTYRHDSVVMNGREVRPPRFYDSKFDLVDSVRLAVLKRKRRRLAMRFRKDNTADRRFVRERVQHAKLSIFRREI